MPWNLGSNPDLKISRELIEEDLKAWGSPEQAAERPALWAAIRAVTESGAGVCATFEQLGIQVSVEDWQRAMKAGLTERDLRFEESRPLPKPDQYEKDQEQPPYLMHRFEGACSKRCGCKKRQLRRVAPGPMELFWCRRCNGYSLFTWRMIDPA